MQLPMYLSSLAPSASSGFIAAEVDDPGAPNAGSPVALNGAVQRIIANMIDSSTPP